MLKGKRSISACSLSSCRLRAEALARAFNNRIWPCVWISQKSSTEGSDGMSNGIDNEEEFFDASPSPVELGDESLFCQQHSSAATEAGRAKLYELLQQHANDDATDVFYDAGEEATLTDTACDTCLNVDVKESDQVLHESTENSSFVKDETYLSNNLSKNEEQHSEFTLYENSQSNNNPVTLENFDNNQVNINDIKYEQTASHLPESCSSNFENSCNENLPDEIAINCESSKNFSNEIENKITENEILNETEIENVSVNDANCLPFLNGASNENNECHEETENVTSNDVNCLTTSNGASNENNECHEETENVTSNDANCLPILNGASNENNECHEETENVTVNDVNCLPFPNGDLTENNEYPAETENNTSINLPSSDVSTEVSNVEPVENLLKKEKHPRVFSKSLLNEDINNDVENERETPIQVTIDAGSPSDSSDSSEAKPISPPLSRLQVFQETRPKIIRSTSLKTGKTPPGTPSRKKIVRFADVLGLDLEDVRHIMTGDLPNIPSSAYTDLNLDDVDIPICEPVSEKVEVNRRDCPSWQVVQRSTSTNAFYLLFSPPGEQSDFLERVRQQGICLETATISEVNVQCTCKVMNYGYHKRVVARYTVNDWLTFNDIDASYILGSSNGETDSFSFSIFLSPLNKSLKLALKYEVNGKEYWDNNRNQNYCFGYHGKDPINLPSTPLPSFQHEFW